jgi:N,N-dimethylformamidase
MRLVGYANTWSVPPGGTISFMVSSEVGSYEAEVVRLIHGDTNPAGPGFKSQPVESEIAGRYEGRFQPIRNGSYVRVPHEPSLDLEGSFEIELFIWPTTPDKPRQALIASGGAFALALADGRLELRIGDKAVRLDQPVRVRNWYRVSAAYDADAKQASLSLEPLEPTAFHEAVTATLPLSTKPGAPGGDLLIAACEADDRPTDFFNGKIDAPRIARAGELIGSWDFAADISSRRVRDVSGNSLDGRVVNMPTRAVTGHNWDGSETSWHHAPEQYGAIHFHDDDLDDAGWEVAFQWKLPDALTSGVYAVHLRGHGEEDHIPFFVRPKPGAPTAKILFLAPVFSYMAYANQQLFSHITYTLALPASEQLDRARVRGEAVEGLREFIASEGQDSPLAWLATYPFSAADRYMVENRLLGLYETHSDGSGVCYASWLRPLVNIRPNYRLGPDRTAHHQLPSDLEFDAVDHTLGSPHDTIVLASATGFSESYPAFDMSHFHDPGFSPDRAGARADMTYLEYPSGGAVFSASSMCWTASLSYNDYDNNVSRITRNVLDRFATGG